MDAIPRTFYLFSCDDPEVPELHSDPATLSYALKTLVRRQRQDNMLLVLAPTTLLAFLLLANWNEFCANGKDTAFHRPPSTLNPIATAPFYAMKCCCELLNTYGGPRRNARAQILDTRGEPIGGLYSAGEFGSLWAHYYQGSCNLSECLVFGRRAVQEALGITA